MGAQSWNGNLEQLERLRVGVNPERIECAIEHSKGLFLAQIGNKEKRLHGSWIREGTDNISAQVN
jgi:hypothetical protein